MGKDKSLWLLSISVVVLSLNILVSIIIEKNGKKEAGEESGNVQKAAYLEKLFRKSYSLGPAVSKPWFGDLKMVMVKEEVLLTEIVGGSNTEDGSYYILLGSGGYCEPPIVYRYDIKNRDLQKAKVDDKNRGCMAAGDLAFSTNITNDVSSFQGFGGDAGCSSNMYYSYDYEKNLATLKKEINWCEGDTEGSETYY